jgi:hypothetical protein
MVKFLSLCFITACLSTATTIKADEPLHTTYSFYVEDARGKVEYPEDPRQTVGVSLPARMIKANWACVRLGISPSSDDKFYTTGFACSNGHTPIGSTITCKSDAPDHQSKTWTMVVAPQYYTATFYAECTTR